MTPKEKATELIDSMYKQLTKGFADNDYAQIIANKMWYNEAKQCALICVGEILKAGNQDIVNQYFDDLYWVKVKQEIQNL